MECSFSIGKFTFDESCVFVCPIYADGEKYDGAYDALLEYDTDAYYLAHTITADHGIFATIVPDCRGRESGVRVDVIFVFDDLNTNLAELIAKTLDVADKLNNSHNVILPAQRLGYGCMRTESGKINRAAIRSAYSGIVKYRKKHKNSQIKQITYICDEKLVSDAGFDRARLMELGIRWLAFQK